VKILVAGASGLVGTALVRSLVRDGHTVCRLVRPSTQTHPSEEGFAVAWNPAAGELAGAGVGPDAVFNLAGASIADGRWTAKRKELLRASRVDTTRALVNALAKMNIRPRVLISASAIGLYGNRGDEELTEASAPGHDFLSGIAKDWEAEARKAEALRIRVVCARFGVILSRDGGALPQMMRPFRFGAGGRIASGKQWMSWIALEDVVEILKLALANNAVSGPLNVVSPEPIRNANFTQALAHALHRPALFPVPAFALRLLLGEMAGSLLLSSQRVLPQQLTRLSYSFAHPRLLEYLQSIVR
jgi:uncharacterized protein